MGQQGSWQSYDRTGYTHDGVDDKGSYGQRWERTDMMMTMSLLMRMMWMRRCEDDESGSI